MRQVSAVDINSVFSYIYPNSYMFVWTLQFLCVHWGWWRIWVHRCTWRFRTSVTSMALHLNCGGRATHWTQSSLTWLAGLTSKPQGSPYLCVSSTWIINAYCHDLAFTWAVKIQIQVLKLVGQTLSQWSNLPSSYMSFYTHEINFTWTLHDWYYFISTLHT